MREIDVSVIVRAIKKMCIQVNHELSDDMTSVLQRAEKNEKSMLGKIVLRQLNENLDIAGKERIPICQDTGMAVVFAEIGQDVHFTGGSLEEV